jgi:phosphoribosylanthranilate isomerase
VEAVTRTGAAAVDVSSGVESAPGRKDPARISAFIRTLRSAAAGMDASPIETLGSGTRTV